MHVDVARQIGAVTRTVTDREHDGKPARAVIALRAYDAGIDEVWDALTSPERLPRWFLPVSGDLKLGGRYQFEGNAGGTITTCEPPRRLGATWEYGGGISWVEVRLVEEAEERTRLELEHTALIADVGPFWAQFGPGATGVGWDLGLMGLDLYLTTGIANNPEQSAEWTASDEGKAFMKGSSDGWGQAAIAYGDDPEAAKAAAERTRGFYTGETPMGG
jgi:hypothetical protein